MLLFRLKIGIAPERRSPDNSAVSARTRKLEVNRMKLYQSIAVLAAFLGSVLYVGAAAKKPKTEEEESERAAAAQTRIRAINCKPNQNQNQSEATESMANRSYS